MRSNFWSTRDALVLKALAIILAKVLPVSARCTNVKGHGGAKAAVRWVQARLPGNAFALRTDVKSYYFECHCSRNINCSEYITEFQKLILGVTIRIF